MIPALCAGLFGFQMNHFLLCASKPLCNSSAVCVTCLYSFPFLWQRLLPFSLCLFRPKQQIRKKEYSLHLCVCVHRHNILGHCTLKNKFEAAGGGDTCSIHWMKQQWNLKALHSSWSKDSTSAPAQNEWEISHCIYTSKCLRWRNTEHLTQRSQER